jgi:hypothetical protein
LIHKTRDPRNPSVVAPTLVAERVARSAGCAGFRSEGMMPPSARSEEGEAVSSEVLDKLVELVTAAFGLVAALAWNTAIQELFALVFPEAGDLIAKFLYAIVVTAIVVFVTIRLGRLAERVKEQERGLLDRLRE